MESVSIFVPPDDGFTLAGNVPGVPGLYPEVSFRYRPATPSTRYQYTETQGAAAKEKAGAEIIERQVKEVRVGKAEPIRLTADQARKLHADIFQGMVFACIGFTGPVVEDGEKNSGSA